MKTSKAFIAASVVALLPLAAVAADKDKPLAPMSTAASEQFNVLDANRDGRISRGEAASDSTIKFALADKNGDGYLDSGEYLRRDTASDSTMSPGTKDPDTEKPRQ